MSKGKSSTTKKLITGVVIAVIAIFLMLAIIISSLFSIIFSGLGYGDPSSCAKQVINTEYEEIYNGVIQIYGTSRDEEIDNAITLEFADLEKKMQEDVDKYNTAHGSSSEVYDKYSYTSPYDDSFWTDQKYAELLAYILMNAGDDVKNAAKSGDASQKDKINEFITKEMGTTDIFAWSGNGREGCTLSTYEEHMQAVAALGSAAVGVGGPGTVIMIPAGLGNIHTYMAWQMITYRGSDQYKFRMDSGMPFDEEGFGRVNGRYVVACTTTYGEIGDYIDVYQEDGTIIPCVIGDFKSQQYTSYDHNPANKWGHLNGNCIIEFIVDKSRWYHVGHANPGNKSCHPEWNQDITKIVNVGSFYSSSGTTASVPAKIIDAFSVKANAATPGTPSVKNTLRETKKEPITTTWYEYVGTKKRKTTKYYKDKLGAIGGGKTAAQWETYFKNSKDWQEKTQTAEVNVKHYTREYDVMFVNVDSASTTETAGLKYRLIENEEDLETAMEMLEAIDEGKYGQATFKGIKFVFKMLIHKVATWFDKSAFEQDYNPADFLVAGAEGYTGASGGSNAGGQAVVEYAKQFVGGQYVWGGTTLPTIENGVMTDDGAIDCSGFVMQVYKHFGYDLPHSSAAQQSVGTAVSESDIQPGDIICYDGHVGIYIGDGKFIHASNSAPYPKGGIKISNNYKYRSVVTIRRLMVDTSGGGNDTGSLTSKQKAVVSSSNSVPSPGGGLCAKWVRLVMEDAGIDYGHYGNAEDIIANYAHLSNKSQIKPGMIIGTTESSSHYGHIGIYIGNGNVISNVGSIKTQSLDSFIDKYSSYGAPVRWGWYAGKDLSQ